MGEFAGRFVGVDCDVQLLRKQGELRPQDAGGNQILFKAPTQDKNVVRYAQRLRHMALFFDHRDAVWLHGAVPVAVDQLLIKINVAVVDRNVLADQIYQGVLPIGIDADKAHNLALEDVQVKIVQKSHFVLDQCDAVHPHDFVLHVV